MSQISFPTQPLDLPSKGLVYPASSALSAGVVELHLPNATHEDVLTNSAFIQQGIMIDKLLQSIIATKIDYGELITGDKNAILIATRILAFGSEYKFLYPDPVTGEKEEQTVNLSELKEKPLNPDLFKPGVNEFEFTLPLTRQTVTFKLLTHKDEKAIEQEIKGIKKVNKSFSGDITTRLKHTIVAVNGNRDQKTIRDFVDTMPIRDSKALRGYIQEIALSQISCIIERFIPAFCKTFEDNVFAAVVPSTKANLILHTNSPQNPKNGTFKIEVLFFQIHDVFPEKLF